jgi:4-hydroxybenzoate polyprenyltransferase
VARRASSSRSAGDRALGLIRLFHPFPSILDGVVTAVVALVAGGAPVIALRLGVAMTAIQFAIGALNDLVDASSDADRPSKPIPAGLVGRRTAWVVVAGCLAIGLALSAAFGAAVLVLAVIGAAAGVVYDLWLKGTPWAPLAYAVGIPLLPVYAWLGATGDLPPATVVLVPAAALAGIGLAIGNALVDIDRDRAAGTVTPATVLGTGRAWWLALGLHATVVGLALAWLTPVEAMAPGLLIVILGAMTIAIGLVAIRADTPTRRERGWELQAIGIGTLAAGWLWVVGAGAA